MTREAALFQLLGIVFSAEELRIHLSNEREGYELVAALPELGVSPAWLTSSAVAALHRRGFIDREFFDGLEKARPNRVTEIRKVRAMWLHNAKLDRGELWAEGRYRLDSQLGQGGFGLVWKAVDTQTAEFVALKILLEQHAGDRRIRQRFFRGASVLARLSHPGIVEIRSSVEQEGLRYFYVMEFLDGECLDTLAGKLSREESFRHLLQIGDALAHIHQSELLHRDIKPSNIFITAKGQAKLIDFDLVTGDAFAPMTTHALGTQIYAPPEASSGNKKTPAYDIFSLARTIEYAIRGREPLYEELTNADPFATLDTSEPVKEILRSALAPSPALRPQTVKQFCADLRVALAVPTETAHSPATLPARASEITAPTALISTPIRSLSISTINVPRQQGNLKLPKPMDPVLFPPAVTPEVTSKPTSGALTKPTTRKSARRQRRTQPANVTQAPSGSTTQVVPVSPPAASAAATPLLKWHDKLMRPLNKKGQQIVTVTVALSAVLAIAANTRKHFASEFYETDSPAIEEGLDLTALANAHRAMFTLGLAETSQSITTLQDIAHDAGQTPGQITAAKLTLAELLLLQSLSTQIAIAFKPNDPELSIAAEFYLSRATKLVDSIDLVDEPGQTGPTRESITTVYTLLALAEDNLDVTRHTADIPEDIAPELRLLVYGAPLWRNPLRQPSNGIVTALRMLPNPSTLHQCLLAIALLEEGEIQQASVIIDNVFTVVSDMRAAKALREAIHRHKQIRDHRVGP